MTAPFPSRSQESWRYADLDALEPIWAGLAEPKRIIVPAGESHSHVLIADRDEVEVHRAILTLEAGASLDLFALNCAPTYGRIEMDVEVHEGARFAFNAAIVGGGTSTNEVVTIVRHVAPNAVSRQTVRSVLGGKAVGSYLGKVAVSRGADGTDGEQSVKAILLDRGATANAKPELEIYADDVKCAHGATVGELDAQQLFYAAARGLPPETAKALLLEGFVGGLWDGLGEDSEIAVRARDALRAVIA